jgi:Na+/proline symporter/signal transduction histidine kinase
VLTPWGVATVALIYVLGLFAVAYVVDRRAREGRTPTDHAAIYSLSLAVYCTSWTFYGSVGRAVASGVGFLPIYLGPTLMALTWWFVLRKTVRIARAHRITSIADFLGSRYGQSTVMGGVVAVITVVGITPYIALQLKAISQTFEVLVRYPALPDDLVPAAARPFYADTAFATAIVLVVFAVMFGARDLDSSRRHEGLVATIAFESLVKLLAFLAVGVYVVWGAFGGLTDIFQQVAQRPEYRRMLGGDPAFSYGDWAALTWLSMMAIMFLPRQFHMAVVANTRERHIKTATWMFPAYLLLINVFVLPIALAGLLVFPGAGPVVADYFVLTLPMAGHAQWLALFAFLGGISAATGMVIVESIALSTMVLNNLVVPWFVRRGVQRDVSRVLLNSKRVAIAVTIFLGYGYYHFIGESYTLVNIGLISFAAVAQFAPAFFGALYWRPATRAGALAGLAAGFAVWAWTLLVPAFVRSGWLSGDLLSAGPVGIGWLRPEQLFGMPDMGAWAHTVFWSLAFNVMAFAAVSLYTRSSPLEAAQAERFVAAAGAEPARRPGSAAGEAVTTEQVESLVAKFVGRDKAEAAIRGFLAERAVAGQPLTESHRQDLLAFAERTLSGAIGTASAQAIMETVGQGAGRFEAIFDLFGTVSRSLEQSREDLQRRVRELTLLNEATRGIAATLDPAAMMHGVLRLLAQEFDFDILVVRLVDGDGRLHIRASLGLPGSSQPSAGEPVDRGTYFGDCFLDNRVVVVEDPSSIRKPVVLPETENAPPRSFVHAPIVVEERPIGVLSAYSTTGHVYFSPEFLQFFRTLAVQLGLGIRNAQLYRELGDLSRDLERKVQQRTAELEEANRRLTELDRLKTDLVSTVSHELRTPLTSIRSLSESLLAAPDLPSGRQQQFLAIITQESERLSRLIGQLLDLSRIEAGKMEWRVEALDLRDVVAGAVETNRGLLEAKGVSLVMVAPAEPVPVQADRDKVIQVLTNLLSNAAKFTPPGGRVSVRTFAEDLRAVVEVEDTGVGIPPDQLEAIFDRFRQVGDPLIGKPEGAGLGLPISREIVQHHGGTLSVRSVPGQGSAFRMALPLAS